MRILCVIRIHLHCTTAAYGSRSDQRAKTSLYGRSRLGHHQAYQVCIIVVIIYLFICLFVYLFIAYLFIAYGSPYLNPGFYLTYTHTHTFI